MKEIVFCLEELSARRFLEALFKRINENHIPVRFIVFEGKQDLEGQLGRRMRGYRNTEARFIVVRDQDGSPDCGAIKRRLIEICDDAGRPNAVVRIACHELEAFYWGDLAAVEKALDMTGLSAFARRAKYRDSDAIVNPGRELSKITNGAYQKVSGSGRIGQHIEINRCTSRSFQVLHRSILEALDS